MTCAMPRPPERRVSCRTRCLNVASALPATLRLTLPLANQKRRRRGYTPRRSVQVSGFTDICLLPSPYRLISASCSSGQRFAFSFLQIRSHPRHPCRSANSSPCQVSRGITPPSECALPGAQMKNPHQIGGGLQTDQYRMDFRCQSLRAIDFLLLRRRHDAVQIRIRAVPIPRVPKWLARALIPGHRS